MSQHPESPLVARAAQLVELWRRVHGGDRALLERLRQGRASEVAGGGVASPVWEDAVRSFRKLVVSGLR